MIDKILLWCLLGIIALVLFGAGYLLGNAYSSECKAMYDMCSFVADNNQSLFNVQGVYNSEGYYCVLDSADDSDVEHEKIHRAVYNDYEHFCEAGLP